MATTYKSNDKDYMFDSLIKTVNYCDLCPRMDGRKKVLSKLNGNIRSKVLFIAEAPGRLGAECTGIPLMGDKTGDNFETLLSNIGWDRTQVFITNSILCNPQDENGNNGTPTKEEVCNCSNYLKVTINLIDPDVIVTLGVKALESLKLIKNHKFILKNNVAQCLDWSDRILFPLYHMGPRALIHRNIDRQRGDFIALSHIVDPDKGIKQKHNRPLALANTFLDNTANQQVADVLMYIVDKHKTISMFKAMKLMYLADVAAIEKTGKSITQSIYLRMQEGPWIPTLKNISAQLKYGEYIHISFKNKKPIYIKNRDYQFSSISEEHLAILNEVIYTYQNFSDCQIKTATYLTAPMKYILRKEKLGIRMTKIPVIYKDKTVMQLEESKNEQE